MEKLMQLIDKYIVPVYQKDGWLPTFLFLLFGVGLVALAVYLGLGDAVRALLGL